MCGTNSSRAAFIRNYVKTKISLKKMFLCCFYAKNGISVSKWSCAFGQKNNSSSFTVREAETFFGLENLYGSACAMLLAR